ncbi:MAG: putative Ig domain-containing protein [Myxococcales bacterium]|nr:putative Ig domain-containing protein [Myxococcales bacterium]
MARTIAISALGAALLGWLLVVGANVNVSNVPGEQEEVDVASDPTSPGHLIAGSNDVTTGVPRVRVYESTSGGASWTNGLLALPSGYTFAADPALAFDRNGNAYFAFISYNMSWQLGLHVAKKPASSSSFGAPVAVPSMQADKEFLAVDANPSSPCVDYVYVAWDNNETFGQTLRLSRSTNGGASFDNPPKVNDTGTAAIGACPAVHPDGTVLVAWADYDGNRILFDRSADCGVSFGADVTVHTWTLPTGGGLSYYPASAPNRGIGVFPYLAVDHSSGSRRGRVYLAYNDLGNGVDIFVRYSDDKGVTWSSPIRVNDDGPAQNDQLLPRIAVDPSGGNVHLIFHDTRNDPNRRKTDVYYASSADGQTFGPNERVSSAMTDQSGASATSMDYGEYTGLALSPNRAHAFWTDNRSGDDEIYQAPVLIGLGIDTASLPKAFVGKAYSTAALASGGAPPYAWSATGLPATLSMDPASGVIAGTPSPADLGTHAISLAVTDAANATAVRSLSLVVERPPLQIDTATLPVAKVGQPYAAQLAASGGTPSYSWSAASPPPWLSLDQAGGALAGTPPEEEAGIRQLSVEVADSAGARASRTFVLKVSGLPLMVTAANLPPAQERAPYSAFAFQSQGGAPPMSWSWVPGFTPPDAMFLSVQGVLSGTPASGTAGLRELRVLIRDSDVPVPQEVSASFELLIHGPPVADPGEDRTVDPGVVALNATRSSDPAGRPLRYEWTAPPGVALSDAASPTPSVALKKSAGYTFALAVKSSADVQSAVATVTYTVNELPPVPVIDVESEVPVGARVVLDGSRSSDPNGDPLSYSWHSGGSLRAELSGTAGSSTSFVASSPGQYTFTLAVSDGKATATNEATVSAVGARGKGCGCAGAPAEALAAAGLLLLLGHGARRRPGIL